VTASTGLVGMCPERTPKEAADSFVVFGRCWVTAGPERATPTPAVVHVDGTSPPKIDDGFEQSALQWRDHGVQPPDRRALHSSGSTHRSATRMNGCVSARSGKYVRSIATLRRLRCGCQVAEGFEASSCACHSLLIANSTYGCLPMYHSSGPVALSRYSSTLWFSGGW
jgi:hypothetical protein